MAHIYYKLQILKIRCGKLSLSVGTNILMLGTRSYGQKVFTSFSRNSTSFFSLLRYTSTCRLANVCTGTLIVIAVLATIVLDWLESARDVLRGT